MEKRIADASMPRTISTITITVATMKKGIVTKKTVDEKTSRKYEPIMKPKMTTQLTTTMMFKKLTTE